ncbi:AAA family ATPase [Oerskovia sp. NPDC060338]|uniref:AAA family ATPase n=1 Tax=Oerskovia sp. NPDC060338 TaxID=3347100 RepID=UPI003655E8E7
MSIPVIPVVPGTKQAAVKWRRADVGDPAQPWSAWSDQFPDHDRAILTGERSGYDELDVDPRNDGDTTLARLVELHGPLPETHIESTRGGGLHYRFNHIDGQRNRIGFAPGLDWKGEGGISLCSGSEGYEVLVSAPVADAPQWLQDYVRREERPDSVEVTEYASDAFDDAMKRRLNGYAGNAVQGEVARLKACADGADNWDDTTYAVACNLLEVAHSTWNDYTEQDAMDDLFDNAPTDDGFDAERVATKWASAEITTEGKARVLPDFAEAVEDEPTTPEEVDADFQREVQKEVKRLAVQQEAARYLAGRDYKGSEDISWDDLAVGQTEWLIDGLVAKSGDPFVLNAKPNLGKTFVIIDMLCSLALGKPWMGKATRQAKSVFVIGEGRAGVFSRFSAWCAANGVDLEEIKPWVSFIDGANLSNDESVRRIEKKILTTGADLVVFDTYAATSGVPNEDDNAMASLMLNRAMKAAGAATIAFTHHPTKASQDTPAPVLRGAGAFNGRVDVTMTLTKDTNYSGNAKDDRQYLMLSTEDKHGGKNRNARTETIRGLYLDSVGDSAALFRDDSEQYSVGDRLILDHLKDGMTRAEFESVAGCSKAKAARALKDSSLIVKSDDRVPRYSLAA